MTLQSTSRVPTAAYVSWVQGETPVPSHPTSGNQPHKGKPRTHDPLHAVLGILLRAVETSGAYLQGTAKEGRCAFGGGGVPNLSVSPVVWTTSEVPRFLTEGSHWHPRARDQGQ